MYCPEFPLQFPGSFTLYIEFLLLVLVWYLCQLIRICDRKNPCQLSRPELNSNDLSLTELNFNNLPSNNNITKNATDLSQNFIHISPYSVQMRENTGKMQTRITPNTDTFYVVATQRWNTAQFFEKTSINT